MVLLEMNVLFYALSQEWAQLTLMIIDIVVVGSLARWFWIRKDHDSGAANIALAGAIYISGHAVNRIINFLILVNFNYFEILDDLKIWPYLKVMFPVATILSMVGLLMILRRTSEYWLWITFLAMTVAFVDVYIVMRLA